ncbi:MAG TPA: PHB depolymerase family esterase, partial [Polyangiaceae bacterium]
MRIRRHFLVIASVGFLFGAQAHAAATKVNQSDWWGGITGFPSYVNMYIHVPSSLATNPPIVVAPHHCGGDGPTTFSEMSSLVSIANSNGFLMIFPEATGQNCWDAGSDRSLNHSGKGDAPAIVQMVKYALSKYNGDASRVYSVGGSSGGIMTEALLGVFPDVFMAGVSIMGVPCGCWAADYNDVTGKPSNGTGQWSGPCAGGNVDKTGAQWGDLVRSYFPGYNGHRPRLQHWHGTTDTTLSYKNMAEDVQEWTNVLGLSETPTGSDAPKSGTARQFWKNACGYTVYETFALSGVGHAV